MKGLISAYATSVKSSGEASSGSDSCYLFADTEINTDNSNHIPAKKALDVIDSGASTTFVTSEKDLTNPTTHTTTLLLQRGKKLRQRIRANIKSHSTRNLSFYQPLTYQHLNKG